MEVNIVVTGITGLRNRGVEALLITTVQQLQARIPNVSIKTLSATPDYDNPRLKGYPAMAVGDGLSKYHRGRIAKLRAKAAPLASSIAPGYLATKEIITSADLIVASGGDVFSSDYSRLDFHLHPLKIALDAGVPVMFLAQSIGPFKTSGEGKRWAEVARRAVVTTLREAKSYDYVTKDLGVPANLVKLTADPAFLLPLPDRATNEATLQNYGIDTNKPFVAFAVSQGISQYAKFDRSEHVKAWLATIQMALQEWNVQVLLVPHVQEIHYGNNDCILATDLMRELKWDPRVRMASGDHTASEFKGMISLSQFVVADRMHAAIAGLSTGVATVPVGYSVKAAGIMDQLFPDGFDGLLISVQDFLNVPKSHGLLQAAYQRRAEVAAHLKAIVPTAKKNAGVNFDMIAQMLTQKQSA